MKKSLIALAALAATASFAQSSVTVYGKANIGFQSTNGSKTALVDQPDGSGSRFGFRGTEDLGGGLKANFTLESGFNLNNGTNDKDSATNQQFQRQSWAGLSSATLGEVRMGRQYTVGFNGSIGTMPSTYSDPALAVGLGFHGMGSRTNDQIQYRSPVFSGFQVQLSTQLAANTTDAATKAAKNNEFGLVYANGPLTANLTGANVTSTTGVKTSPIGANPPTTSALLLQPWVMWTPTPLLVRVPLSRPTCPWVPTLCSPATPRTAPPKWTPTNWVTTTA